MEYKFKYINTHKDLVDGYNAVRSAQSGMSGWSRGLVFLLGVMWLLGFIFMAPNSDNIWQPLIWLILGCAIIWRIVLKPYLEIKFIKESNEPEQEINLMFTNEKIEAVSGDGISYIRNWDELEAFEAFKKGIFIGFSDGAMNWLPIRVFKSQKEKEDFVKNVVVKLKEMESS